ncbi:MAG: ATP-binding protein [Desmonostoc vinosum HA7617-LM4]|jgi:AAA+ superfamily predicted ATPase|nr:ATP-binding protein [Desmonostoc vinosum HA7617-LM4]
MDIPAHPHAFQPNIYHVFTAVERVRQALQGYIAHLQNLSVEDDFSPIPEFLAAEQDAPTALDQICSLFQLSAFERDILMLCMGMELDPNFEILCAEAHAPCNRNYPTFGLAFVVFSQPNFRVLSPQSPLWRWQLIEVSDGPSLAQSRLRIDRRILCYLLGEPALDARLSGVVQKISIERFTNIPLPPSQQQLADQIAATWVQSGGSAHLPIFQLCGGDFFIKQSIVATACHQLGYNLMQMCADFLPVTPEDCYHLLQRWCREAMLTNSVLLLDCDTLKSTESTRTASLNQFIEGISTLLIVSSQERWRQHQRPLVTFDVPALSYQEQLTLWQTHLGDIADNLHSQVEAIATQFKLSPVIIQAACLHFKNHSSQVKLEDGNSKALPSLTLMQEDERTTNSLASQLWDFCRVQARPQLDDLAQRIESHATWDDLVLPDRDRQVLQDIATHLRQRVKVYQEWGFAKKGKRGLGISALFHGQSGTGKTLAAEVLAREFRLDLYRIDLSTTVSKYIGETEKNLQRIFDAAEAGGVILLFDEADALFGKRTEVKDSHDRHANVEVSYLLQRMEAYQGLAILTTNLKDSIDQAFMRRIRFSVAFPFPHSKARAEIWQRIFPPQTPTDGLDIEKLANLSIAGGNIRNIALNAAFLAADAAEPVRMSHLLQAAQREYYKLERNLTDGQTQGWV